jgi:putative NAD(P)H nitroreductase
MNIIDALKGRRSINFFDTSYDVQDKTIDELLSLANLSPSSFNLQPWRVIVVKDKEKKKALRKCAFDQPKAEEASAVLIVIGDPDAVELNGERVLDSWVSLGYMKEEERETYRGLMKNLYGEKESITRKLFAAKNASIFAMGIMIAARGMNLETHPMDGFDEACVKKEFGIPGDKIIPMLIAIGRLRPDITLLPRAFRRGTNEFTGYDTYK